MDSGRGGSKLRPLGLCPFFLIRTIIPSPSQGPVTPNGVMPSPDWCHRAQSMRGNYSVICWSLPNPQSNYPVWEVSESETAKEGAGEVEGRWEKTNQKTVTKRWKGVEVKTWITVRGYSINEVNTADFWINGALGCRALRQGKHRGRTNFYSLWEEQIFYSIIYPCWSFWGQLPLSV